VNQTSRADESREARESERKAAADADIERQEVDRATAERGSTEAGVGEHVDIEA
jgi:hypothetical protein